MISILIILVVLLILGLTVAINRLAMLQMDIDLRDSIQESLNDFITVQEMEMNTLRQENNRLTYEQNKQPVPKAKVTKTKITKTTKINRNK